MKTIPQLLSLLILLVTPLYNDAQTVGEESKLLDCSIVSAKLNQQKSFRKTVSMGVLNGRALSLPKPEYSAAARAINARGLVKVSVVIDEAGCVTEANAVSGDQLLRPTSTKAAKASIFESVLLGGTPVRVTGVITYNYLPTSMNWLELGFNSDSIDRLDEYLPIEFADKRILRSQSKGIHWTQNQKILNSVRESLGTKLLAEPRNQWLFLVGNDLRSLKDDHERAEAMRQLKARMTSEPTDVSPRLSAMIKELLLQTKTDEIKRRIEDIESRLYTLGR